MGFSLVGLELSPSGDHGQEVSLRLTEDLLSEEVFGDVVALHVVEVDGGAQPGHLEQELPGSIDGRVDLVSLPVELAGFVFDDLPGESEAFGTHLEAC